MLIEGPIIVKKSPSNPERVGEKLESTEHAIKVSHPEKYLVGQKVKVTVKHDYGKDSWDLDRLNFEVEKVK